MNNEQFEMFLKERINMASSIQTKSAYIIVMEAFKKLSSEKIYSRKEMEDATFVSFVSGYANTQLDATQLISFHKEWFENNFGKE